VGAVCSMVAYGVLLVGMTGRMISPEESDMLESDKVRRPGSESNDVSEMVTRPGREVSK